MTADDVLGPLLMLGMLAAILIGACAIQANQRRRHEADRRERERLARRRRQSTGAVRR